MVGLRWFHIRLTFKQGVRISETVARLCLVSAFPHLSGKLQGFSVVLGRHLKLAQEDVCVSQIVERASLCRLVPELASDVQTLQQTQNWSFNQRNILEY